MIDFIGLKHIRSLPFADQNYWDGGSQNRNDRRAKACSRSLFHRGNESILWAAANYVRHLQQAGLNSCDDSWVTFLGFGKPPFGAASGEMFAIKIKYFMNKGKKHAEHYWALCTIVYLYVLNGTHIIYILIKSHTYGIWWIHPQIIINRDLVLSRQHSQTILSLDVSSRRCISHPWLTGPLM